MGDNLPVFDEYDVFNYFITNRLVSLNKVIFKY